MAEQNINPGIQALQKAGYTPEQIGQFGQIYNQRAIAMGYGEDVPKMYVPTQDDNASIIQEFSRSITNATLPTLAKGITLIPQILTNAAGFAPQALDEWTNDIIKSIDQNYTGYVNPMHNRGMFEKNDKGEWSITDARSILNGFGSGIGSLVTAFGLGAATGTGAAGVVASAALMSLPELWKSGQEAGLADIDNARMSLVLAPIIGGLELIGGLETGLLKSFEKEVVGELAEGAIARGLKSAGLKESLELIGKSVPDEAMFKDATAASIRKLSTWGAKFASGKTVKQGFGESKEEYLQNFVTKAGEQIYDTWFSEAGAKPGQGQYGTELFVPETDQRAIGPSFLGVSYNKDEFYDDLQSAIYGGILGHGMSAITTPVVNQSMYGYIDVAVKKGRADGAIQQMSGLIQQNIQEGRMTEEQGKQAMTTATNMVGLANLLKNTPVTTTPTLRYAVYDNQYNKIPKYNQVTQGFEDAAKGLSAMLEDNMAGIAQVAALQDEVKRMYPEYKKSQLRTQVTNNFIRSIVTKGEPTDLEGQLAEIDKMQFDIMEDDAFKDLMRGYMLALPQIGSESRGFEPPAGPPSVPPAGGTPPPAGGGGAAPSGTTPPTGGITPPPGTPPTGTPPTGTPPPSETPPTKPVEESGQMAPAGKPQTWVQAMGAPVLFRGQEGTIVYDDTDGYLFIPEETSNEVVITKDSSQNPADLGIEFTNTYNPIEYAVQEQTTDEGVLRPEQPQVELQQMGKGDQESQVPAQEGQEKEITPEEKSKAPVSDKKADIERKRQEELNWERRINDSKNKEELLKAIEDISGRTSSDMSMGFNAAIAVASQLSDAKRIAIQDLKDIEKFFLKGINAKYDAELSALEGKKEKVTDEEEKQPMLEGLPDGRQQEEGGQEGAELRPEAEEKVLTPEAPQAIADMQQELEGEKEVSDNELEQIVGRDVYKAVKRDEERLGSGVINRSRMISTARKIQEVEGKSKMMPEHVFEALFIEIGYYDNWNDLRSSIKKGGIDTNSDIIERHLLVGVDLPIDIVEEYQKSQAYSKASLEVINATKKIIAQQPPKQQIDNEAEAIISGEDRESSQGLDSLGASLEGQGAAGAAEAGGVRPEAVQQPGSEGQGATGGEQIAEGERKGEPAANRQDFIQTASEGGVGQAAPEIKERYDNSTKYVSVFDEDSTLEKVLPEGSKRKVKVMLGEASAVAPSHSPFTFVSTPGFPKNESGQNINTTDYSEYKNTQLVTIIATNFDSRALDDIPFVKDGIVYSGNNRAMSRQLAATQGTDAAYISALRQQARRLGFTEEQINSLKHPFVWMEIQDDIKPTSEEYAKYNQPREKQQDPIAEAVAMGKKVNQSTLKVLGDLMGRYDTFNQFASSKDAADFIRGLIDIKLINYQMAMSFIDESGKVNDKGKTFLRSMLLGNVLSEDNVRKFSEEGFLTYTNRIMNAISELSWNLGKEAYSILADVNDALKIQKAIMDIQAKTPGAPYEGALQAYLNQRTIGEKIMSPNAILLNVLLNKGDKDFKKVMNEYIQKADEAAKGAFDMFAGPAKVVSKDEIIADIMNAYMEGSKLTDIEKGVINSYAGFIKEQAAGGGKAVINEVDNAAQADQVKAKANNIANKYKKC